MGNMATENAAGNRIEQLLDAGSFVEIGGAVTARTTDFNMHHFFTFVIVRFQSKMRTLPHLLKPKDTLGEESFLDDVKDLLEEILEE